MSEPTVNGKWEITNYWWARWRACVKLLNGMNPVFPPAGMGHMSQAAQMAQAFYVMNLALEKNDKEASNGTV